MFVFAIKVQGSLRAVSLQRGKDTRELEKQQLLLKFSSFKDQAKAVMQKALRIDRGEPELPIWAQPHADKETRKETSCGKLVEKTCPDVHLKFYEVWMGRCLA